MNLLSADIETYGMVEQTISGKPMPRQTVFHPQRSLHTDSIPPIHLIQTASITIPRKSPEDLSPRSIAALEPGDTMVFNFYDPRQRKALLAWYEWADCIIGMNFLFDILYQRVFPDFRRILQPPLIILDLGVVNYLHNENRPERSLKTIGPILGTHKYDDTTFSRYLCATDPAHIDYNAQDSHNTLLDVAELARRILLDFGEPPCSKPSSPPSSPCSSADSSVPPSTSSSASPTPSSVKSKTTSKLFGEPPCSTSTPTTPTTRSLPEGSSTSAENTPYGSTGGMTDQSPSDPRTTLDPTTTSSSSSGEMKKSTKEGGRPSNPSGNFSTGKTTSKLSYDCIQHYSNRVWVSVAMAEAGIPMSRSRLVALEHRLLHRIKRCERISRDTFALPLSGPGSGKAKLAFMELLCDHIDLNLIPAPEQVRYEMELRTDPDFDHPPVEVPGTSIRDDPRLVRTRKRKDISFNEENRNFLSNQLPRNHPAHHVLKYITQHTRCQKIHSSYVFPLLYHHRRDENKKDSVLIGGKDVQLAYPSIFIIPSPFKDDQGGAGGTLQGRITFKGPPAQTFPPPVKKTITSRYPGGTIVNLDLSQIELRVAALLSGDATMVRNYQQGLDLHADRAISLFGESTLIAKYGENFLHHPVFAKDTRGERQVGKTINFLDLFRGGADTAHDTVLEMTGQDLSMDIFHNMVKTRSLVRPGLWAWQEELIATAQRTGYIELPIYGQSRYFLGGEVYQVNEIVNFPVQTTAGNLLIELQYLILIYLVLLHSTPPLRMFLNVYDSMSFDVPPGKTIRGSLNAAITFAFDYIVRRGYWHQLQEHYGREVPLEYEITES